jgi:hypothetical protein
MVKHWRWSHIVLLAVVAAVVTPAVALAGKKVVSGEQSLQLKVSLKPARAGAKGAVLTLEQQYLNPKHPGQQPPYNSKTISFSAPKGFVIHPHAVPQCKESVAIKNGAGVCPASSKVGAGRVVVNARPSASKLITGTITEFNGINDGGYAGFPKGSPEVILYIKSLSTTNFFHLVKNKDGSEKLVGVSTKPSKPGVAPGSFTIQYLKLSLFRSSQKKPYFTNPPTCHGSWPFSLTTTNYFGQPSITAHDSVRCTK